MKHQPYESWIFAQEDLELDQAKELQVHLKLCDRCAQLAEALNSVETRFSSQELVSPADGFSSRWRERLDQRKRNSFRLQTSVLFGGLSIGAGGGVPAQAASTRLAKRQMIRRPLVTEAYAQHIYLRGAQTAAKHVEFVQIVGRPDVYAVVVLFIDLCTLDIRLDAMQCEFGAATVGIGMRRE